MAKSFFFLICFLAASALLWPIAQAVDLAGVSPWSSPLFVYGLLAVVASGTLTCLTLLGGLQD